MELTSFLSAVLLYILAGLIASLKRRDDYAEVYHEDQSPQYRVPRLRLQEPGPLIQMRGTIHQPSNFWLRNLDDERKNMDQRQ